MAFQAGVLSWAERLGSDDIIDDRYSMLRLYGITAGEESGRNMRVSSWENVIHSSIMRFGIVNDSYLSFKFHS